MTFPRRAGLVALAALAALPARAQLAGLKAQTVDLGSAESALEDTRVQALFDEYLAGWAAVDPEAASELGIHDHDDRLTSRDAAGAQARLALVRHYLKRAHDELHPERLDGRALLRYKMFLERLEVAEYGYEHLDERLSNPLLYLRLWSILSVADGEYGPLLERVPNALSRLEQWPAILAQGKENLQRPPRLWTEAAISEIDADLGALDALAPAVAPALDTDPEYGPRLKADVAAAKEALLDYKTFLLQILERSDGSPAVGEDAFDFYMLHRDFLDESDYKLLRFGEKSFKRALKELKRAAKDADRHRSWQDQARDAALAGAPAASDDLLALYRAEAARAKLHFDLQGVVTDPGEAVSVEAAPPQARLFHADWDYRRAAPLDPSVTGRFYVTLPDPSETPRERADELAWGHNALERRVAAAEEAWPGRHVQEGVSRHVPSLILRSGDAPLMSEGWAQYALELGDETGYFPSAPAHLVYLRSRLLAAARVIVDVHLHCGDWSAEDSEKYLEEQVLLTPMQANAEVLRISLDPTAGMAGAVGLDQILRLRHRMERRLGDQFTLKEFDDRLLSYGNVPPALIEPVMVDSWRPK